MRILSSAYTLDLSGLPTFTLTMYNELVRRGHNVTIYSPTGGKLEREMETVKSLKGLSKPDVIIAQHNLCAIDLKKAFPDTPMIFYSHGFVQELEQPPPFPADFYFVINEEVQQNFIDKGIPSNKIVIIRDFIDTERFKPVKPINNNLQNVLFLSNYKKWKNYYRVSEACKALRLNLTCIGSPYGRRYDVENAIQEADLVISWARGILEAMSCGRAALSFDRLEGDGYITKETYFEARKDNFSGRHFHYAFDRHSLANEILKYNPADAEVNRDLILNYHEVKAGVNQILDLVKKIMSGL